MLALLLLAALSVVFAQEGDVPFAAGVDPLTRLSSSPTVDVAGLPPAKPHITLGEVNEVICSIYNNGPSPINVTHMQGGLLHPQDPRFRLQNFSDIEIGGLLRPGFQWTDPMMEPRSYTFVFHIFYQDDFQNYSSLCYNATLDFVEPDSGYDLQGKVNVLGSLIVAAAFGYAALKLTVKIFDTPSNKKKEKKSKQETSEALHQTDSFIDDHYLVGKKKQNKKQNK